MAGYNEIISRTSSGSDPLVPEPFVAEVIKEMPRSSVVMQLARRVPMSSKSLRQPVMSVLPEAYFVNGDTGRKQTTAAEWENLELVAEEIAVIVPIPEAYLDDSAIPVWSEVRPYIAEAFGRRLDRTALFNEARPQTWGEAVLNTAVASSNTVSEGSGEDLAEEIAALLQKLAEKGVDPNGFATAPGFKWRLTRLRSEDGVPIYAPPAGTQPGTIYGMPLPDVRNGAWFSSVASLIVGDWSKAIWGVRQDMTFRVFTEGVISDDEGNVVLNLMQQDAVALRVTARFGWQIANPVNPVEDEAASRSYFGALVPASS
ncbi:MAG TPA: phage major capsid protein [Thermobifida alba]|nr:phage major capsid protein [Thermobifida alba]